MRFPQVLIYESDGRLAEGLRREPIAPRWSLREPRSLEACLKLLRRGGPSVLVLRVGTDLVRELTIVERVTWLFPETATVVVGELENPAVADLAWMLGAACVLFPPLPRHLLADTVSGLLGTTQAARPGGASAEGREAVEPGEAEGEGP